MNIDCPHCHQNLEIDDALAGKSIECSSCHRILTLPRSVATQQGAPPVHLPLQPAASVTKSIRRKKSPLGCSFFFWVLTLIAAGAFGFAMYRWRTSPQETMERLVTSAQRYLEGESTPAPEVEPGEESRQTPVPKTAQATPRPDPIPWLVEHKDYWPKELILQEPQEFPAISGGKKVGSLTVPAGSVVTVKEITKQDIAVDFMGGESRVAVGVTDLMARADAAFRKAEFEAKEGRGTTGRVIPKAAPEIEEEPAENIREASAEEIGKGLGALYTHGATTFRLFAPNAKSVHVVLYTGASTNEGRSVQPLRQESSGLWDTTLRGDLRGKFYTFLLDAKDPKHAREVLDPYAVNAVASSTRGRITPMTMPVAPGPRLESPTDAIVYEMHVRDFTVAPSSGVKNAGLYLGWTEPGTRLPQDPQIQTALDHLTELGVTHVELMPVQDFENDEASGAYNWGYITSDFLSPEGMFASNPNNGSRVRELKALVTALHARGLSVIMDVVYNHTSGKASLMSIAPEYYYRRGSDGGLANGSGCGNEFKSESPMARRLILDSLKFWVKEYGIDGFRFDLMALIDQDTIRQADRELRAINPSIVMFGEPWTGGTSPLATKSDKTALRELPAGAFNDDFRNALKGQPDGNDPGWIQNGSKREALKAAMLVSDWFASPGQSINYMTCHDNLVLWDKLVASMPDATDALRIATMKLGYLALFTSQGVPFIHGGEEFARTKGGNNNSYESPDSVNQVDWTLKREHLDLFNYVRDLIALRKAHSMFRLRTRTQVQSRVHFLETPDHNALMLTIDGDGVRGETWKRVCLVLNSADQLDTEVNLPGGNWLVAFDEHGAAAAAQAVSGKMTIRHKSGVVLYQP